MKAAPPKPRVQCQTCHFWTEDAGEYHPYAFCVMLKAGLNPHEIVADAMRYWKPEGWRLIRDARPPTNHSRDEEGQ
jgi:hypothetical protein